MTTTTTALIDALTALSCDAYTVTATVRGDTIVASYRATSADLAKAEDAGADASARIAAVLKPAGYAFSDAGGDDPGIYEVWHAPAERTYVVEGCGADQTLQAVSPEAAAQEAAEWQHGGDGAHEVRLTWRATGSDSTTIAVFDCEVDGETVRRVTVREVADLDDAEVALHNDPACTTLVSAMTDAEIALCIHEATTLDADILTRFDGAFDTDREYVAAYAAAVRARYGAAWTLP